MRNSGYPEDDAYSGTFEWWRQKGSGVVIAVRLDQTGVVTGAVRPLREDDLGPGSAKGFMWDESTALRNHVRSVSRRPLWLKQNGQLHIRWCWRRRRPPGASSTPTIERRNLYHFVSAS
jgi:hypothetical protein